ncbi:MAG: hypothetical protein M0R34_08915 [Candidatus Marinimicrobia bacterium]|nr:hypothetical protein [Candidatus Neomarinimicrobiota bacterium]
MIRPAGLIKNSLNCRTHIRLFLGLMVFLSLAEMLSARQNGISYEFDLEFNPRKNTVSGTETIVFTNHTTVVLDTIFLYVQTNAFHSRDLRSFQRYENQFEAPAWIDIESVKIDAQSATIIQPQTINPVILLPESLLPGDSIQLSIQFTTKIPSGKSYLCSTRSDKLFRLIYFYPRIAENRQGSWQITQLNNLEQLPLEYANFSLRLTMPQNFHPVGSLQIDSVAVLSDHQSCFIFHPEYLQDIGFIINDKLRVLSVRQRTRSEIAFINRFSAGDRNKDKIITEIIRDIVTYYSKYFPGPNRHLTVMPTTVKGGFSTSNLILIDRAIFAEVTKLDYLSLYILAREIARQYLGFDYEISNATIVSISNGLAGFLANEYMQNNYQHLQQKHKIAANHLMTFTNKFLNIFTAALERESILQPARVSNDRANTAFISTQTRFLKSQKLIEMTHYALGDSLFGQVLEQYRNFILFDHIDPYEFFKIAEKESGYQFASFYNDHLHSEQPPDIKIQKIKRAPSSNSEHITNVIIQQNAQVYLPLEISATDLSGNVHLKKELTGAGKYDTLTFVTARPIRKVSLDPNRQIWDSNRFNNQYPRSVVFKFLIALPSIDSYQIFYYPTFDFNTRDLTRVGIKLRGRYWINMRPLFPAQSLDEWSFGLNYGYKSKTLGYDLSYSTSLLAFLIKPRIYLRLRDYFDLMETQVSSEVYLGDITYWGFSRVQGYQKLNFGLDYQKVRSLQFLNTEKWETGESLKPYLDYVNFHNWGNIRHIVHAKFVYGLPIDKNHFSFDKLTLDGHVKLRLSQRIWLYQRLFFGNAHGNVPKQEYFYFFGKNVLENQSFEAYRLAQGEGDMRGYGDQSLKGYKILTGNTELRRNLAGVGAVMFDFLLFLDSGILPKSFRDIDWQQTRFDAGLGIELEILEILKVGMHFPLWVSHPSGKENAVALRWVVTTDLRL